MSTITIDMYLGGNLVGDQHSAVKYIGGTMSSSKPIDPDLLSIFDLMELYQSFGGRAKMVDFYYARPDHYTNDYLSLVSLGKGSVDVGINEMISTYDGLEIPIKVFVVDIDAEPLQIILPEKEVVDDSAKVDVQLTDVNVVQAHSQAQPSTDPSKNSDKGKRKAFDDAYDIRAEYGWRNTQQSTASKDVGEDDEVDAAFASGSDEDEGSSDEGFDDCSDPDFHSFSFDDIDSSSDEDKLFESSRSKDHAATTLRKRRRRENTSGLKDDKEVEREVREEETNTERVEAPDNWYTESEGEESLNSDVGDEEESGPKTFRLYKSGEFVKKWVPKVGERFSSFQQFREFLRNWCILNGYDLKYTCKRCLQLGHHQKSCKNPPHPSFTQTASQQSMSQESVAAPRSNTETGSRGRGRGRGRGAGRDGASMV